MRETSSVCARIHSVARSPSRGPRRSAILFRAFRALSCPSRSRSTPTRVGKTHRRPPRRPPPRRSTPTRVGKTLVALACASTVSGPPPRAWGKRGGEPGRAPVLLGVHPHARGENCSATAPGVGTTGPPPRAWGKHLEERRALETDRSTPTRVGKTARRRQRRALPSVHPHARGENVTSQPASPNVDGPPPRAWGKLQHDLVSTPTRPVHPHARGENYSLRQYRSDQRGPPPRAWGKRAPLSCQSGTRAVHPHARGENASGDTRAGEVQRSTPTRVGKTTCEQPLARPANGPPPRAWGKLSTRQISAMIFSVHPHARGENARQELEGEFVAGPPPRAWGKRPAQQAPIASNSVHPHARGEN